MTAAWNTAQASFGHRSGRMADGSANSARRAAPVEGDEEPRQQERGGEPDGARQPSDSGRRLCLLAPSCRCMRGDCGHERGRRRGQPEYHCARPIGRLAEVRLAHDHAAVQSRARRAQADESTEREGDDARREERGQGAASADDERERCEQAVEARGRVVVVARPRVAPGPVSQSTRRARNCSTPATAAHAATPSGRPRPGRLDLASSPARGGTYGSRYGVRSSSSSQRSLGGSGSGSARLRLALRLGRAPRRRRGDLEHEALGRAHEEHGRRPLDVVVVRVDRLAGLGERRVDRVPVCDGGVELAREDERRAVGDLELHGDDGRYLALDEARRDAGERVVGGAARSLAGVEDGEAQRALVGEHRPEVHAAHLPAAPVVLLEQQQPVLALGVEDAVPDEVEDVVVVAPQRPLQRCERARAPATRSRPRRGRPTPPARPRASVARRPRRAG